MAKLAGSLLGLLLLVCTPLSFSQISGSDQNAALAQRATKTVTTADPQRLYLAAAPSATIAGTETGKTNLTMFTPFEPVAPSSSSAGVKSEKPVPAARKSPILDRKFATLAAFSAASMLADIELTAHCSCREVNPLYGSSPTRARLYAINAPFFVGEMMMSRMLRKKFPGSRLWLVPGLSSSAAHMAGVAANLRAR